MEKDVLGCGHLSKVFYIVDRRCFDAQARVFLDIDTMSVRCLGVVDRGPHSSRRTDTGHAHRTDDSNLVRAFGRSCRRGATYGPDAWVNKTAKKLGLESTLRSPGRPKKAQNRTCPGAVPVCVSACVYKAVRRSAAGVSTHRSFAAFHVCALVCGVFEIEKAGG